MEIRTAFSPEPEDLRPRFIGLPALESSVKILRLDNIGFNVIAKRLDHIESELLNHPMNLKFRGQIEAEVILKRKQMLESIEADLGIGLRQIAELEQALGSNIIILTNEERKSAGDLLIQNKELLDDNLKLLKTFKTSRIADKILTVLSNEIILKTQQKGGMQ